MSPGEALELRARAAATIRAFFDARGVLEVHTAPISAAGVTDVHLDSVRLADGRFLRTSPEFAHKRLLARERRDLYELGPVFRAGEHGRLHREQFWLLEWYRTDWGWRRLADEAVALVRTLAPERFAAVEFHPWSEVMIAALSSDPIDLDDAALGRLADDAPGCLQRPELYDWLFATRVQPLFPSDRLTVVHDYPACQAALARLKPGQPDRAERFELFAGAIELGNGYRELTDAAEQRARFVEDNARRRALGRPPMPIDESLLAAMERGLPECSGIAIGFERLLMAISGQHRIDALELPV